MAKRKNKNKSTNAEQNMHILQPYHIKLDMAYRIVNLNGRILNKTVLETLKLGQMVRISMHLSKRSPFDCRLLQDAPYVKIIEIKNQNILGEILGEMRTMPDDYFPLRAREHVWFTKSNIIEIPEMTTDDELKFGTNEYVPYTGPLETVDPDYESSIDGDNSDSESSDSDADRNIDLRKKNPKAPLLRGRPNEY